MNPLELLPPLFRPIVARHLEYARQQLESGKDVETFFVVGNAREKTFIRVPVDTSNEEAKEASAAHARMIAKTTDADFFLFLCEAWTVREKDLPHIDAILGRYGTLAAYPGRIDVLTIGLETRYGRWIGQAQATPMPPSKRKRALGKLVITAGGETRGRFGNIIDLEPELARGPLH